MQKLIGILISGGGIAVALSVDWRIAVAMVLYECGNYMYEGRRLRKY